MSLTSPAAISFRDVCKSFSPAAHALKDVSFDVSPGEFCVVLGASGSGKTTLLRSVNGLTELGSGSVFVAGKLVEKCSLGSVRRSVAMVHQHFGLIDRLTVVQNVMSGAAPTLPFWRAMTQLYPRAVQEKACSLLASVGLDESHVNRLARHLSGGQRQRVGIARALIMRPVVILADEPAASLDPKIARDVLSLLHRATRARGVAVLCSLHQLDLAREFADRIVALRNGRVIYNGATQGLSPALNRSIYGSADSRPLEPTSATLAAAEVYA